MASYMYKEPATCTSAKVSTNDIVVWLKDHYCTTKRRHGRTECSVVRGCLKGVWPRLSDRQIGNAIKKAFPMVERIRSNSTYYYTNLLPQNLEPYGHEQREQDLVAATEGPTQQPIKVVQLNREFLCFSDGKDASINGDSSIVYLATYEGLPVAVKQFKPGTCIQRITREADFIISMGPHECLPLLFGIAVEKEPYLLILKFYGSYQNQLSSNLSMALILPNLPSNLWVPFMIKLAKGVAHLHAKNHIHGNLKKEHIMVYKRKGIIHPKLVGLGSCLHDSQPEAKDQELLALGHILSKIFNKLMNRHPSLSYFLGRVTDPLNGSRPKASEIAEKFESLLEHFA